MILWRALVALLVITALAGVVVLFLLPPSAIQAPEPEWRNPWPVVRGAFHIHSVRSDGTGSLDEIAKEAADVGLQFVIITDHGDATRAPEPPSYRSGVLVIDAIEISTQYGHYIALGLPQMPYRLAGHPRDVIDDVHRAGAFGVAAHPGSPKLALRWDDWDAEVEGLEWLNADSEWRDEFWGSLGRVLFTYPFRPVETLASLLDRPTDVLTQWDRLARKRRVFGIAGADAHARFGYRESTEPYQNRVIARVPSYRVSFGAFINHVVLDGPLTGEAAEDAARVLTGIHEGRIFTSIDGLARLGAFEAKAISGSNVARIGEYLDLDGPAAIDARIAAPEGTTLVVLRDGETIYEAAAPAIRIDVGTTPGAYRIEARLATAAPSVPWLLANPIYIGLRSVHADQQPSPRPPSTTRRAIATYHWRAEADEGSSSTLAAGTLEDGTPAQIWQFGLAPGPPASQFAALRFPLDNQVAQDRGLTIRMHADRPLRLWAQLRGAHLRPDSRWGRTFYVGPSLDQIELRFAEFRSLGPVPSDQPALDAVDSLLLVVDTVNTAPGTRATVAITDLWLVR